VRVADEIEYLARVHRIRFITLADENPTTDRVLWQQLLEEIARRDLGVHFFSTIRATDIVRHADLLPLARRAGLLYVLMGIETTDAEVMRAVKKGSTPRVDREACRLLRENGIKSVLGHIVGLEGDSWASLRRASRALREYDGDYLNAMYVTPHDWTPFGSDALATRGVVEPDPSRWDYRHQVLASPRLRPWELFTAVKLLELRFQLDPRRLRRTLFGSRFDRQQWTWVVRHIGLVWLAEIGEFAWRALTVPQPPRGRKARRSLPVIANISPRPERAETVEQLREE
jgi:anaerobic magnesium-protoporphyrin IX monomethyl ester cyclase